MGLMDNDVDMQSVENRFKSPNKGLQVGGDHYEKMKIQPAQFARANDYDSDAFSILKYLMRHNAKDGLEGVKKARSFITIRINNNREYPPMPPRSSNIKVEDMCAANGYDVLTRKALMVLHAWVHTANIDGPLATLLGDAIEDIIRSYQVP